MDWNDRWLYSWHMIGLDSEAEAFDIILITHPASVEKLPKVGMIDKQRHRPIVCHHQECIEVPEDFDPQSEGPGQCLWRELTPLSGTFIHTHNHTHPPSLLREGPHVRSVSQQSRVSLQSGCKFPHGVQVS